MAKKETYHYGTKKPEWITSVLASGAIGDDQLCAAVCCFDRYALY